MSITVTRAGFFSTVQDLGRVGFRARGVSSGGALDQHALAIANLLVGNEPAEAGIELGDGRVQLRFADERLVAWCGGGGSATAAELPLPAGRAALLGVGEELIFAPTGGGRAWLAISGGINVPVVLGSRSTDLRSQFGGLQGRALVDGDLLPLGVPSLASRQSGDRLGVSRVASFCAPHKWCAPKPKLPLLRIVRGSAWQQFETRAQAALLRGTFEVMADSDRMGARLHGPELRRLAAADLVSEAVLPGTVQVPPGGQPIMLLGDCQTIGGYPKIAHVITVDLPIAAQLRAGDRVRFVEVSLDDAQRLLLARERDVQRFRVGLSLRT